MNMSLKSDKFNSLRLSIICLNWRQMELAQKTMDCLFCCPEGQQHTLGRAPTHLCFLSQVLTFWITTLAFKSYITLIPVQSRISESYQQLKLLSTIENLFINQRLRKKSASLKRGVEFTNKPSIERRELQLTQGQEFPMFISNLTKFKLFI